MIVDWGSAPSYVYKCGSGEKFFALSSSEHAIQAEIVKNKVKEQKMNKHVDSLPQKTQDTGK